MRSPAGTRLVAAALAAALVAAGCGAKKQDLAPAACLTTNEGYLRALERAPAPVRLTGSVPISSCLVPEQQPGQLADIGHALLIAATKLNVESRRQPGGPASVQLGYLLGAIAKGSDPIHTDLVRRVNAAAQFTQGGSSLPASFQRAFGRGYQAGHTTG